MSGRQSGRYHVVEHVAGAAQKRPERAPHNNQNNQRNQFEGAPPRQLKNLPSTASLVDNVDKKVLIVLRDGRKLIGYLRSFDQFGNMLLQDTTERIFVGRAYGDIERGVYVVRGESVILMGELDEEVSATLGLEEVSIDEILARQHEEMNKQQHQNRIRNKILRDRGLQPDGLFEDNTS